MIVFKSAKYLVSLVIILGFILIWYGYQITKPVYPISVQSVQVEVKSGEGVKQVVAKLIEKGVLADSFYFEMYVWQKRLEKNFKTGVFTIEPETSIKDLVQLFVSSGNEETTILIREGERAIQIAENLAKDDLVIQKEFLKLVSNPPGQLIDKFDFLNDKPARVGLEGYLFPDTYRIFRDADSAGIIEVLLKNFDRKLTSEIKAEIKKQDWSIYEVVTLASIIEREVKKPEDMKLVADIFKKRLDIGQALQADSTVNYVTGKKDAQATLVDTKIDNPYNTYRYNGLPPGPISNPGLDAIKAVVYPEPNNYYYFLTSPDSRVIYSKSYNEHLKNKAKYLKQ